MEVTDIEDIEPIERHQCHLVIVRGEGQQQVASWLTVEATHRLVTPARTFVHKRFFWYFSNDQHYRHFHSYDLIHTISWLLLNKKKTRELINAIQIRTGEIEAATKLREIRIAATFHQKEKIITAVLLARTMVSFDVMEPEMTVTTIQDEEEISATKTIDTTIVGRDQTAVIALPTHTINLFTVVHLATNHLIVMVIENTPQVTLTIELRSRKKRIFAVSWQNGLLPFKKMDLPLPSTLDRPCSTSPCRIFFMIQKVSCTTEIKNVLTTVMTAKKSHLLLRCKNWRPKK